MTRADVAAVIGPMRDSGWGDRRELFDLFLALDRCTPFAAFDGGDPIATGCAIVNGPVGWIGMIWVRPDRRRGGLGRLITERVCEQLEASGCATLVLIASPDGKPVYDLMGFRTVAEYAVYEAPRLDGFPADPPGGRLRRARPDDLAAVARLDSQAIGEDRGAIVEYLLPRGWVVEDAVDAGGSIRAFLLPTDEATGAVIAERREDGLALLDMRRHLAPSVARASVLADNPASRAALEAAGWRFLFTTPRMIRGPEFAWGPSRIWGLLGFALG